MDNIFRTRGNAWSALMQKAETLIRLNEAVKAFLPPELSPHCQVVNWREGCLVIATRNASVDTMLRFQKGDLLHMLRESGTLRSCRRIEHYVDRVDYEPIQPKVPKAMPLSAETRKDLVATAEKIKHKGLRQALLRLAEV